MKRGMMTRRKSDTVEAGALVEGVSRAREASHISGGRVLVLLWAKLTVLLEFRI